MNHSTNQVYDVVVCGGGPAGIGAAMLAARLGCRTLLLERYGRLGGMAVSGLVQPVLGTVDSPLANAIIARLGGRRPDFERFDLLAADEVTGAGATLLLHCPISGAQVEDGCLRTITVAGKSGPFTCQAKVFVDATGDGDVAFAAGAEYEQGRPGDGLTQPMSIMFRISGVDESRAFRCGSEEEARTCQVAGRTWHEIVTEGQAQGLLPASVGIIRTYLTHRPGERGVNATQVNYVNGTSEADLTRAELEGRRQAFQVLDFLRTHAPGYEDAIISAMPAVIGVRETRRFRGIEQLVREDLITGRRRPDAVVKAACFCIDIHNPDGSGQAEGFAARAKPYDIPYGCLVPRDLDGLLLAGRCISGTHDAHASYRVMAIALATGAAAGTAAAIACRDGVQPRQVDPPAVCQLLDATGSALR